MELLYVFPFSKSLVLIGLNIILSTAAVIFLGTPHRGSPGLANLGEIVRRIASTVLRVDSNATVLRTLGCNSPELELCRELFTTQWR
jgi:hypothetical protein